MKMGSGEALAAIALSVAFAGCAPSIVKIGWVGPLSGTQASWGG